MTIAVSISVPKTEAQPVYLQRINPETGVAETRYVTLNPGDTYQTHIWDVSGLRVTEKKPEA
jgi:hypothetical protein